MTRYELLKKSAKESAKLRGHRLSPFAYQLQPNRMVGHATCLNCGAGVTIDTNPMANGIDIGGEAVALGCAGKDSAVPQGQSRS